MTTYFWGAPPGAPGDFDDANDWFNTKSQTFGDGTPGTSDIVNVVGAVPIPPAPPVLIVTPSGAERSISQLRVLAQDTAVGKDITALMGKVAVSLAFVREQDDHHTVWAGASDIAAATTLLQAVTADPRSVLVGVRNAEIAIAAHA